MSQKFKIIFLGVVLLVSPLMVSANQTGETSDFFIDSFYDLTKRSQTSAVLVGSSSNLYFYIDESWWNSKSFFEQSEVKNSINFLVVEFEENIYPKLTSIFGPEPEAGPDGNKGTVVLIHPMMGEAGGYFNSGDIYEKLQYSRSNERKIIYLNSEYINGAQAKSFLAHEFVHLITVNQKDLLRNVTEEIWLNEARAEYAPTLIGYNDVYRGSNLERRVRVFLEKPSDSLTEWLNFRHDYGVVNLFTQYLVDHYGVKILVDSLHSAKAGIPSINEALAKNGFKEDFSRIFTDWTVAVLINDCSLGSKYCYLNEHLTRLRIIPQTNFLPLVGESSLSVGIDTKNWTGNWHKIIGGKDVLKLEFQGSPGVKFQVPYLVEDAKGKFSIDFLQLDETRKETIHIPDFNTKNKSLIIIPSIQSKIFGFNGQETSYQFSFIVSTIESPSEKEQDSELVAELQAKIKGLEQEIKQHQASIDAILAESGGLVSCQRFDNNLYFGMMNNAEVECLQEFLKNQGSVIYPEGLVTGNFLVLTRQAVARFQEKYKEDILVPLGLFSGTGYFGPSTREKINQLINLTPEEDSELIAELSVKIKELEEEIAQHQASIDAILPESGELFSCQRFDNNLYFGMMNNAEVVCLQEFLKSHGPLIYPEGLVTGNFLSLTQQAVIRFQEKYASEILYPLNLQRGTGYFGPSTREKINNLIK